MSDPDGFECYADKKVVKDISDHEKRHINITGAI